MAHDLEVELSNARAIEKKKTEHVTEVLHHQNQMNESFTQQRERVGTYVTSPRRMQAHEAERYVRHASPHRYTNQEYVQTSIAYKKNDPRTGTMSNLQDFLNQRPAQTVNKGGVHSSSVKTIQGPRRSQAQVMFDDDQQRIMMANNIDQYNQR